jgi:hypothetical protein
VAREEERPGGDAESERGRLEARPSGVEHGNGQRDEERGRNVALAGADDEAPSEAPRHGDRREERRETERDRGVAQRQPDPAHERERHGPEEVGVPLDALAFGEHEAAAVGEVRRVPHRDVCVVRHPGERQREHGTGRERDRE